jgi:hypothetical protein
MSNQTLAKHIGRVDARRASDHATAGLKAQEKAKD